MPKCVHCKKKYNEGGDGWNDYCPSCADRVSNFLDEQGLSDEDAHGDRVRKFLEGYDAQSDPDLLMEDNPYGFKTQENSDWHQGYSHALGEILGEALVDEQPQQVQVQRAGFIDLDAPVTDLTKMDRPEHIPMQYDV